MTVEEARTALCGPLRFGDSTQIEAIRTIEKFEETKNLPNCFECNGTGQVQCEHCEGTGYVDCDECDGTGKDIEA